LIQKNKGIFFSFLIAPILLFIARALYSIFVLEVYPIVDHLWHSVEVWNANLQLNVDNHHWKIPRERELIKYQIVKYLRE
jgi:hypothetical protein